MLRPNQELDLDKKLKHIKFEIIYTEQNKKKRYIHSSLILSTKTIFFNIATCCHHLADIRQPHAPICFRFLSFIADLLNLDWKQHKR